MRGVTMIDYGGPDVLSYEQIQDLAATKRSCALRRPSVLPCATVIASAGSDAKPETARRMGATAVVTNGCESPSESVSEATYGRGVDLVYDHVGGEVFVESLKATPRRSCRCCQALVG